MTTASGSPDYPLVGVREGPGGRLPYLLGTEVYVWQVLEVLAAAGSSVADAAAFLGIPEAAVRAAAAYDLAHGSGFDPVEGPLRAPHPGKGPAAGGGGGSDRSVVQQLSQAFGLLAGFVAIVYVTGGAVLAIRLKENGLPWEPVVGQLPREFLISVGLSQVMLPALAVGGLYGVARVVFRGPVPKMRRLRHPTTRKHPLRWIGHTLLIAALLFAAAVLWSNVGGWNRGWLALGAVLIGALTSEARGRLAQPKRHRWRSLGTAGLMAAAYAAAAVPLSIVIFAGASLNEAKLCASPGFAESGLLIGQTSDRVYLGEAKTYLPPQATPRISIFPTAQVEELFVGADAGGARCDARGAQAAVSANFGAGVVRRHVRAAVAAARKARAAKSIADTIRFAAAAGEASTQAAAQAEYTAGELEDLIPGQAASVRDLAAAADVAGQMATRRSTEVQALSPPVRRLARRQLIRLSSAAAADARKAYRKLQRAVRAGLREALRETG